MSLLRKHYGVQIRHKDHSRKHDTYLHVILIVCSGSLAFYLRFSCFFVVLGFNGNKAAFGVMRPCNVASNMRLTRLGAKFHLRNTAAYSTCSGRRQDAVKTRAGPAVLV